MSSVEVIAALGVIAEQQWGYVTTAQAATQGVSRDRLSKLSRVGVLVQAGRGVYRMAGAPAPAHEEIYVSYLALRERAKQTISDGEVPSLIVGGKSAALLHDMGDYWPGQVEFYTQVSVRSSRPGVTLTRRTVQAADVVWLNGLPVLSGNATLCALAREGGDLSLVAHALMDGLHEGKIDLAALAHALDTPARTHGYQSGNELAHILVSSMPVPQVDIDWYLNRLHPERVAA